MAEITKLSLTGDWRIVVQSKNAGWAQRVLLTNTENGTQILDGIAGRVLDVYGDGQTPWELAIQHNDGNHGWQNSWLREQPRTISGGLIRQVIESEDITTASSDRDFDDLVIRLEKLGMVDQPARPHAVHPNTLMIMPDGVFEASLGRYFMGVTVRNIWTNPWPANATVGLTQRSRQWLVAGGVQIVDAWSSEDQAILNQQVVAGRVQMGGLRQWESRVVYFKVNVSNAAVRKHQVEVEVAEPISHINRKARSPLMVSRTVFDTNTNVFVSECDRGRLVAAIREIGVDYNTLKRAVYRARELFRDGDSRGVGGNGRGPLGRSCNEADIERLRQDLLAFLKGKQVDICDIWRRLQCCCAAGSGDGHDGDGDDSWGSGGGTGLEVIALPTLMDYRVEYVPGFTGTHGPIPFDDPWWKVLLIIIAIILTLAAAASAAADLANRSDDVVIGEVTRSRLDDLVDAAVVRLNGNRTLTAAIFSILDAEAGEENEVPVNTLGTTIDTAGGTMSNAEIAAAIAAFVADPTDPVTQAGVRVFKSGARTGLTFGRMRGVEPSTRDDDDDGVADRTFQNQIIIEEDPAFPNGVSDSGDSGSLWIHLDTMRIVGLNHAGNRTANTAIANRIEDVMDVTDGVGIRFA